MFFETSRVYYDQQIVIHSARVWVLAELGLIGFVVLSVIAINILNLLSCLIKKTRERLSFDYHGTFPGFRVGT